MDSNDMTKILELDYEDNKRTPIPSSFGNYTLFRKIYETKYSVVCSAACCSDPANKYAIKIIPYSFFHKEKDEIDELALMAELCHKYIMKAVNYYEYPQDNPRLVAIVMYFMEDFFDYLFKNNYFFLAEVTVGQIMNNLFNAVGFMHSKGICHRDIKLKNIFIKDTDNGPFAILGDLSCAKAIGQGDYTGECVGTIFFAAPELLKLDPNEKYGINFLTKATCLFG